MGTTEKFNNRLKVLRAEKNITQAELADLVGVTRSTINYLEKNEYMPSLPLAMRLASQFVRHKMASSLGSVFSLRNVRARWASCARDKAPTCQPEP